MAWLKRQSHGLDEADSFQCSKTKCRPKDYLLAADLIQPWASDLDKILLVFLFSGIIIDLCMMYDDYHCRIFEEKTNFSPQDGNSVIEIADDEATVMQWMIGVFG